MVVYRQKSWPSGIYEAFPYFNMALGLGAIVHFQTLLTSLSGSCFFIAGAIMWILRSDHRRKDQLFRRKGDDDKRREWYELKPFLCVLGGVLCASWSEGMIMDLLGAGLAMVGVYLVIQRILYRKIVLP